MPEKKEIFSDGLEAISILDGLFRLDFYSLQSVVNVQTEKDKEEKLIFREENLRLILPAKGFIEALERMLEVAQDFSKEETPDADNGMKVKAAKRSGPKA